VLGACKIVGRGDDELADGGGGGVGEGEDDRVGDLFGRRELELVGRAVSVRSTISVAKPSADGWRSRMVTVPPLPATAFATAAPRPDAPPVTTTWPCRPAAAGAVEQEVGEVTGGVYPLRPAETLLSGVLDHGERG
jgi:hypothetical protein